MNEKFILNYISFFILNCYTPISLNPFILKAEYVCMYVCIYLYICVYTPPHIHICMYKYIHMDMYKHLCIYILASQIAQWDSDKESGNMLHMKT